MTCVLQFVPPPPLLELLPGGPGFPTPGGPPPDELVEELLLDDPPDELLELLLDDELLDELLEDDELLLEELLELDELPQPSGLEQRVIPWQV
ncbi:MAG TPA: hypothetical protein VMU17_03755 [Elusimicrobiota bacterium]|nr:hypothetical protein [Elusimicrobiota bacterium]